MKKLCMMVLGVVFAAGAAFAADADNQMPRMKSGEKSREKKQEMMKDMMQNPHHKLAMAYKKNLMNFAVALKSDIRATGKVDKDLAETAVKEMRNSLDQVKKHHDEAKGTMSEDMKTRQAEMIKMMESRLATVGTHLDNLEKEVKADNPDPNKVRMELDQIVQQCEMMKMKHKQKKQKMQ